MRVAVISDVHGNAFALEAVLKEVKKAAPDVIINLGDQVEGYANPHRAALLQAELNAVEIRGNNEEKWWPNGRRTQQSRLLGAWLETQLSPACIQRLSALPLTAWVDDIFCCHGSPDNAWRGLLWQWHEQTYQSAPPYEIRQQIPQGARVVVCGHTHRAGVTMIADTLLVNVGSVSDQVDGDPRARWSLLERNKENWTHQFRMTAYDTAAAVHWAQTHSPICASACRSIQEGMIHRVAWPSHTDVHNGESESK